MLQRRHALLLSERAGEVGPRDLSALSSSPDSAGRHSGRPPAGRQSAHPVGQVQGAAGGAAGGQHVC